jgi:subtilisin family serine protease
MISSVNKKIRQTCLTLLCLLPVAACAFAGKTYCFRLYLKDKGASPFSIASPEAFLSEASVERRRLREVFVDESDFPISQAYIDDLTAAGVAPVVQSKWMKTVVVESADSSVVEKLKAMPFVDSLACVWNGCGRRKALACDEADTTRFRSMDSPQETPYGYAEGQMELLNGHYLHTSGYRGKGIRIAAIDAGFLNVDRIDAFSSMHLIGACNITFPGHSVFCEDDHGTKVLSCIAANLPGVMIGAAPDASFLLIKSEDTRGEYPIEEDFWTAAVEYADSVGVDIISSSLGYFRYDSPENYYCRSDLNGQTAFVSRVAGIAARKGLLIVCSAGNEGNTEWEKITFPADAEDVLTVGSVTPDREKSAFSSTGMTADYRIKPDVMALGTMVCVTSSAGQVQYMSGTSFSAPIIAGMAACLWQAFPLLKNTELIHLIKSSSSRYHQPDAQLGYGIPNMFNAYNKAYSDVLQNF